VATSELL